MAEERELLPQGGALCREPGHRLDRSELAPGRLARTGAREVRAQGHDRAQAAQRLRAQARIRHAAQGAPRGPVARATGGAGHIVAPGRFRSAPAREQHAAAPTASRPRSTRSSSRWWATPAASTARAARPPATSTPPATEPAVLARDRGTDPRPSARVTRDIERPPFDRPDSGRTHGGDERLPACPPLPTRPIPSCTIGRAPPAPVQMAGVCRRWRRCPRCRRRRSPALSAQLDHTDFSSPFAVEVSEVVHDPELDEAVIAFANADFSQCEESCSASPAPGGTRAQHAETWLVLFDLYRATGQQPRFESLAIDYAQQFGWSAPQWYSLPKLVAEPWPTSRPTNKRPHRARRAGRPSTWAGCARRAGHRSRGTAALADLADAAALGVRLGRAAPHRRRGRDAAVGAVPAVGRAVAGDALDCRRGCLPCCRTPRPPACAMPTRRSG
jgi:hypothetical protein